MDSVVTITGKTIDVTGAGTNAPEVIAEWIENPTFGASVRSAAKIFKAKRGRAVGDFVISVPVGLYRVWAITSVNNTRTCYYRSIYPNPADSMEGVVSATVFGATVALPRALEVPAIIVATSFVSNGVNTIIDGKNRQYIGYDGSASATWNFKAPVSAPIANSVNPLAAADWTEIISNIDGATNASIALTDVILTNPLNGILGEFSTTQPYSVTQGVTSVDPGFSFFSSGPYTTNVVFDYAATVANLVDNGAFDAPIYDRTVDGIVAGLTFHIAQTLINGDVIYVNKDDVNLLMASSSRFFGGYADPLDEDEILNIPAPTVPSH